jgi:CheY-like chemotaxis protein
MPAISPNVLIVEDDDAIRDALAEVVARAGYRVSTARHGGEALEMVDREPPALVLLDLMMPVVDGWTFLRTLEETNVRIPVVVMTAAEPPDVPAPIPVLSKPVSSHDVMKAIAAWTRIQPQRPVDIALYVCRACEACERTIETLIAVLDEYQPDDIALRVHNVAECTRAELDADGVMTTPTIRMHRPLPLWFVGELRDRRWLRTVLDTVGAQRSRGGWRRN